MGENEKNVIFNIFLILVTTKMTEIVDFVVRQTSFCKTLCPPIFLDGGGPQVFLAFGAANGPRGMS